MVDVTIVLPYIEYSAKYYKLRGMGKVDDYRNPSTGVNCMIILQAGGLTSYVHFPVVYSQSLQLILLRAAGSGSWQYPATSAVPPPFLGPGQGPGGNTDPTETHHCSPDHHQSLHSIIIHWEKEVYFDLTFGVLQSCLACRAQYHAVTTVMGAKNTAQKKLQQREAQRYLCQWRNYQLHNIMPIHLKCPWKITCLKQFCMT